MVINRKKRKSEKNSIYRVFLQYFNLICREVKQMNPMKKFAGFLFLFSISCSSLFSQNYNDYFIDKACRIDLHFCGNVSTTNAYLDKIVQEPFWGGRRMHLTNDMNLGQYRFQVLDSISNKLIYTDGFSTLYYEWQSTPEALLVSKSFEQSVQFPYPQKSVKIIIEKRLDFNRWEKLIQFGFSPFDQLIRKTKQENVPVKIICKTASTEKAIDIAVIAEGYTVDQRAKFFRDAKHLAENLFTHEPFAK